MSEDSRMARNSAEPPKTGAAGATRWADYLDWLRGDVIKAVLALPEEHRRTSWLPSGWSPIELLSHLAHMEQRWFVWGFLAEDVAEPWGDWDVADPTLDPDSGASWHVADETTTQDVVAHLDSMGERTRTILGSHDLAEQARVGGRFAENPPTLEWICFHVLAEYARHAGQLDVALETRTSAAP